MKTTLVTPVALLAVLAGAVNSSSREEATMAVLPEARVPAVCLPDSSLGSDGGSLYDVVILRHARKRRLNPRLVKAIVAVESQFLSTAVSHCGALGLMQVMPATAAELGVKAEDLWDPETNISAGTDYLAFLFKTARRRPGKEGAEEALVVRRVIAAYYSGPGALDAEVWSEPTRRYVRMVLSCYGSTASVLRTDEGVVAQTEGGGKDL
jgi:soluble lytic murein transglycosylase-like protein